MGDDALYSQLGMASLLSKYNISIVRKEDGTLLLVQFTSETTYIPLGYAVSSYEDLWKLACEVTIQVHYAAIEKKEKKK